MELEKLTKQEKSLLLYIETCATDRGGIVDSERLNDSDTQKLKEWTEAGFVEYKRLASECTFFTYTHCCFLSDDAVDMAHKERKARYKRLCNSRKWYTTEEKRNAA